MDRPTLSRFARIWGAISVVCLAGCATSPLLPPLGSDSKAACETLKSASVSADKVAWSGLTSGAASIDSATWETSSALSVNERAPFAAAAITPAAPPFCKLVGRIAAVDPSADPILFQVNLPAAWNGRSVQFGGGGFNGTLITAQGLLPSAPFGAPGPLARGYATVGTDSGHQIRPGTSPMAFALNDEMLVNFSHAAYPKVRNVSVELMKRFYGRAPDKLYFLGSSEGGREALTMAQRYPAAFDGIFSRVPVISWTGLQFAGTRAGAATFGDAWLNPGQVKLFHDAQLAACDALDGVADGIVSNVDGCRRQFQPRQLLCKPGDTADSCLNEAQVRAIETLRSPFKFPIPLANGLTEYPGWGIGGENTPPSGSAGGWRAWWMGTAAPAYPPVLPGNGIAWFFGAGALQHFYARSLGTDPRNLVADPNSVAARIREVSELMDSTNPDLSAFHARGGKLIVLEHLADYAQSPYAGIRYIESVQGAMGPKTSEFVRLFTAPGVDHVATGAPANVDMLDALSAWVERGRAPAELTVTEQDTKPPFKPVRVRPLCEWPEWPRYKGAGDPSLAGSFECASR